ncbi:MAG: hypothetical protein JWO03_3813 [Bacteroidetes bacterium]|nr:hypothetical protein [Bacteroidota bacterium]
MRKPTLIFILLTYFITILSAQSSPEHKPFVLGITDQIRSAELGEMRTLNIYLPQGYTDSNTTYPVIYLLDGGAGEDFVHICGIEQFLSEIVDTMPKAIIVGIANTDRKRDFTFSPVSDKDKKLVPTGGGSAKFISFIEKELQPYINRKYKAGKSATLIGQSLGGLLASEILVKKPELFDRYLIVSPSLWWHDESLLADAPEWLGKKLTKETRVYIAVGKEEKQMQEDAKKLADLLKTSGKTNLKVDYNFMPEENHLTILHNAAYKGFEVLFSKK